MARNKNRKGMQQPSRKRKLEMDLYLAAPEFRIHYFVPHPDQDLLQDQTPFQGATSGLIETMHLLDFALSLPADVREICVAIKHWAVFRVLGHISHRIIPIEFGAFNQIQSIGSQPVFKCVLVNANSKAFVEQSISNNRDSWLTISDDDRDALNINSVGLHDIYNYCARRVNFPGTPPSVVQVCKEVLAEKPGALAIKRISLREYRHNLTIVNETGLRNFGCRLVRSGEHLSPGTDKKAIRWIADSFDFARRRRKELVPAIPEAQMSNAILLSVPSVYRRAQEKDFFVRYARKFSDRRSARQAMQAMVSPDSYIWSSLDGAKVIALLSDPDIGVVLGIRQAELRLYTSLLMRLSAGVLLPTIRLPPAVSKVSGLLKMMSDCIRAPGYHKRQKKARLLGSIQSYFTSSIPKEFKEKLETLDSPDAGIKLVSDVPLEWMRCRGTVVGLQHECSRIPVTPLALCYGIAVRTEPQFVSKAQITNILVVRSFNLSDPIRGVLERALSHSDPPNWTWPITVKVVDVATDGELCEAIRAHSGAILIFDCHGKLDSSTYAASIIIGNKPLLLSELRGRVSLPPIVLLSACDTYPLDGSHASVANSCLTLGAITVLATLTPISATQSALFLARLIFRIGEYIPSMLKHWPRITWRHVVTGMLRMSHATEVLYFLLAQSLISDVQLRALLLRANQLINPTAIDWYDQLLNEIAMESNTNYDELLNYIDQNLGLTEAMCHIQLGSPELINIVDPQST
jgi:hypothetical protein